MPRLKRIGLIGDIHAEDQLLEQAISRLQELGAEQILAVGDLVDGKGDVDRCVELLEQHGVLCVRGNHERWILKDSLRTLPDAHWLENLRPPTRDFLRSLPATRTFETAAGTALLCHGLDRHDMIGINPWDLDEHLSYNEELQSLLVRREFELILNGHTHHPMDRVVRGVRGGQARIINAGTLQRNQEPCYVFLDLEHNRISFHALNSDALST